jgi:hypothetical protein
VVVEGIWRKIRAEIWRRALINPCQVFDLLFLHRVHAYHLEFVINTNMDNGDDLKECVLDPSTTDIMDDLAPVLCLRDSAMEN